MPKYFRFISHQKDKEFLMRRWAAEAAKARQKSVKLVLEDQAMAARMPSSVNPKKRKKEIYSKIGKPTANFTTFQSQMPRLSEEFDIIKLIEFV